jgi:L-ascorbate metabolism protein UlaG (beta-lactamase superfamily)
MKRSLLWTGAGVTLLSGTAASILSSCASLDVRPEGERLSRITNSAQWTGEHFENEQPLWWDPRSAYSRVFESTVDEKPTQPVPIVTGGAKGLATPSTSGLRVTWFGHSSVLLEIDGSRVLTDPFWGERSSPVSWAGPKRWYSPPIALNDLPKVDAVVISHDHYDHLDRSTIAAMTKWDATFVVPLGVGAYLVRWGISETRVRELDWWESLRIGAIEIVATPSRHASGRNRPQSDQTLWAGYAFIGPRHRAWYSGDTGFHSSLERIGTRFGPFDATLIESGQYDGDWPDWHLGPEQAVEAHRLVQGQRMIPVHWGLLKLAHHSWTEPVERVLAAAQCKKVDVLVPRPGESIEPTNPSPLQRWWPRTDWRSASEKPIVATRFGQAAQRVEIPRCDTPAPQETTVQR